MHCLADDCARHGKLAEQLFRISEPVDQAVVPGLSLRIYKAGACRIRVFLLLYARQDKVEIIGEHEKGLSLLKLAGVLIFQGHELIDCVELLALNAGSLVELTLRDHSVDLFCHAVCASVAVSDCISDHVVILIKKDIIDRPGVDADRLRDLAEHAAAADAIDDAALKQLDVPAGVAAAHDLPVLEAVHLLELHDTVLNVT